MSSIIKTSERVRDFGEVFTQNSMVCEMLDVLPTSVFKASDNLTFFEPSCGDGNFLNEILKRKLVKCNQNLLNIAFIVSSLYGVDIIEDNVIACKKRLSDTVFNFLAEFKIKNNANFKKAIHSILNLNILVGNTLVPESIKFVEWECTKSGLNGKIVNFSDMLSDDLLFDFINNDSIFIKIA